MKDYTIVELKHKFIEIYGGDAADLRVFSAPGRVNLIGEHIDYNGGYVFPAAITKTTTLIARKTNKNTIRLCATDLPDLVEADISRLDGYRHLKWGNYQIGTAYELSKAGYQVVGCDLLYHGNIPYGSGLSSSASIEVATAIAFATFSNEAKGITKDLDMPFLARLSQAAEQNYVGVSCGIMDQFASAMGQKDHAILLNCKDLSYRLIPLKMDGYKLVIANTNKKRSLADSKYNERRRECEAALESLRQAFPDANYLCDIKPEQFEDSRSLISCPIIAKRAEHVVYENERVLKSVAALEKGDLALFGKLMCESHDSLRDLYEVTGIELDTLVSEALKAEGILGSRMTGAGFGGCSVSIVAEDAVDSFIDRTGRAYRQKIGYDASFYISDIGDGGREIF